jgi:hypothetical protein
MKFYTENDVLKMTSEQLVSLRLEQSDMEREDILSGAPSRFEGCIRCEDVWVKPTQIQGASNDNRPRTNRTDAPLTEPAVPAEHA